MLIPALSKQGQHIVVIGIAAGKVIGHALALNGLLAVVGEDVLDEFKEKRGVKFDRDLTADDLMAVVERFKAIYKEAMGVDFPQDPKVQLMEAVKAVFRSWDNPRANIYRMDHDIPYSWGTAVNVQMMGAAHVQILPLIIQNL